MDHPPQFDFIGSPDTYKAIVQRRAVYPAVFGRRAIRDHAWAAGAIDQLRGRMLARLHSAGVPIGGSANDLEKHHLAARRCLPTFAIPRQAVPMCGRAILCPFCYARDVLGVWRRIDAAMFAGEPGPAAGIAASAGRGQRAPKKATWDVVLARLQYVIPFEGSDPLEGMDFRLRLSEYLSAWNSSKMRGRVITGPSRGGLMKAYGLPAAFEAARVGLSAKGGEGGRPGSWTLEYRQVLAVEPDREFTPLWGFQVVRRDRRPNRRRVLEGVAWACRYPAFVLRASPERVGEYLRMRRRRRLWATFG